MKLKNKYYLIRHGEADFNLTNINDSHGDPNNHLTRKGIIEVENCAERFNKEGVVFEKIISSPFPRAKETAEIFLKYTNINNRKIYYSSLIKEMNHGSKAMGKPIIFELEKSNAHDELHTKHGDGESFWDVRERVSKLITELENKYEGKVLLIVTHGSPLWMLYSAYYQLNEEDTLLFKKKRNSGIGYFIKNADPILIC